MLRSMTGYGQGQAEAAAVLLKVEIRAVNSRFREVTVKMPHLLMPLEDGVRRRVSSRVERGRVEVFIRLEGEPAWRRLKVNQQLAREYLAALNELKSLLDLPGQPDLNLVAAQRDVVCLNDEPPEAAALQAGLEAALDAALGGLTAMREIEGERLKTEISSRLAVLADLRGQIMDLAAHAPAEANEKLRERLTALIGQAVEPARLAQEAAVLADRLDVTEEVVRLDSHLAQFHAFLDESGAIGRKLDFLVQEINREFNTIGSKCAQANISRLVVEAKAELEKIREQVQNIE